MQCPTSVLPIPNTPEPSKTFWTACPSCKMQYQYLQVYENYQLQCPKCKEVFLARNIHSRAPSFLLKLRKPSPMALKRKKQNSEQEDGEGLADDDPKNHNKSMQDEQASPALPGRRPSGAKKNAAKHEIDIGDDSDLDDFPVARPGKIGGEAENGVQSEDEEAGPQQSEKVMKGTSGTNDSSHGRRRVGANSSEELDGRKHVNDRNGGDQGEPAKKDPHRKSPETFWTSCSSCKMQYQYLREYQYYRLWCFKCKEYFEALDIKSTAPSSGAGRFGLHVDPLRQDFGSDKQPETVAFNGAGDGGLGRINSFRNHASSAAFFSSAAAAAAQLRARVEAAADAALSAMPPKTLAADVAQESFVKVKRVKVEAEEEVNRKEAEVKKKEEEVERKEVEAKRKEDELKRKEDKLERKEEELERKEKEIERKWEELRKMKDWLREENEVQGKALEAARSWEAVERLVAKHQQQEMARDPGKKTVDTQAGRKVKRKKQESVQENDEDLEMTI